MKRKNALSHVDSRLNHFKNGAINDSQLISMYVSNKMMAHDLMHQKYLESFWRIKHITPVLLIILAHTN